MPNITHRLRIASLAGFALPHPKIKAFLEQHEWDKISRIKDNGIIAHPVDATGYLWGTGAPALDGEVKDAVDLVGPLAKSTRVRQSIISFSEITGSSPGVRYSEPLGYCNSPGVRSTSPLGLKESPMPKEGLQWWHVIISTLNSWLPGDNRGFRSRGHKIYSSGDYKNPPPPAEHAGLLKYHQERAGNPVVIPKECRERVGRAILAKLKKLGFRVLTVAVAATHSHWLVELPKDEKEVRQIVGQCKTKSSHAIRDRVPGRVWAYRGKNIAVEDRQHQLNVYQYILDQRDAWIWDFKKEDEQTQG